MNEHYIGILSEQEPLHHFLADQVMKEVLGYRNHRPVFEGFCLDNSSTIFRFADRRSFVNLVAKFYGNKWIDGRQTGDTDLRAEYMQREFDNLKKLRALGLDMYPHAVARPLAVNRDLGCVLVEEFVWGTGIEYYIWEAADRGRENELKAKLSDLAWFLADLHTRSQQATPVDQICGLEYFEGIVNRLFYWKVISDDQRQRFMKLRDRWGSAQILNTGRLVLNHGDPNFPHFLCHGEHGITSVDLERLWLGDRAMDIGCVVAELKHLLFEHGNGLWASEPYIQHFYQSYYDCLPESVEEFSTLTTRGRFYMGCFELRIGENAWLDLGYRRALINEAEACLKI
jgi:hypothetical protein